MRLTPRRKPTINYNRSVIPLLQVFHLQHLDACGTHCVATAFLRYLFVYNAHCRCGLMCGTADAFKESVSAHHAARNRAAASAPLPPHGAIGPSAAAVEECLFGEGAGSERWLHEYILPHPYHINRASVMFLSRCAASAEQPRSYWCEVYCAVVVCGVAIGFKQISRITCTGTTLVQHLLQVPCVRPSVRDSPD